MELDSTIPPVQNRPWKVLHMMKAAIEVKIRSLVQCGVSTPAECPTECISNLTAVWKADKKQVCVCLDPRDLNRAVRRNHFNMPTLDDVLPKLKDEKIFSLLDAKDGFRNLKDMISQEQLLTFYDVQEPVVIQCDASTEGLGATLL